MTWERGRDDVERLLNSNPPELVTVEPNAAFGERLIKEAEEHLRSAATILSNDPPGSFQLAYDAARKSCEGLLAVQGLHSTQKGGHIATADVVRAQFNGANGKQAFGSLHELRRARAGSQYPSAITPPISLSDATHHLATAKEIVDASRRLFDSGKLTPF